MKRRQAGLSLIEVLVALLVMCIGLLGAAAIQLNALKYTDGSARSSQASFVAYDMMDRIRANAANVSQYALANLGAAPTTPNLANAIAQDRYDFAQNVLAIGGTNSSKIEVTGNQVTITIFWDDSRAGSVIRADGSQDTSGNNRNFVLVSRVAADAVVTP
jgi:type IV pilus assembly protein PilV